MAYEAIRNDEDPSLVVYIDRSNSAAGVFFSYDGEDQVTPFQTADMPMDDEKAWRAVNDYAESL